MLHPSSLAACLALPTESYSDRFAVPLRADIEEALDRFGAASLTAREQEVVRLILRGLPSKLIARTLEIAPKTENVHRRNAYAKLGVDSRSSLFFEFLVFLSEFEPMENRTDDQSAIPLHYIPCYDRPGAICEAASRLAVMRQ